MTPRRRLQFKRRPCAMAILAMPGHGRDARATKCAMAVPAMPGDARDARATKCAMAILAMPGHGRGRPYHEMCHGRPGHARTRAGRPCHEMCHGHLGHARTRAGTPVPRNVPWPSRPCPDTGGDARATKCAMAILAMPGHGRGRPYHEMYHGRPGHARTRAGTPVPRNVPWPSRPCPDTGGDARGTNAAMGSPEYV